MYTFIIYKEPKEYSINSIIIFIIKYTVLMYAYITSKILLNFQYININRLYELIYNCLLTVINYSVYVMIQF